MIIELDKQQGKYLYRAVLSIVSKRRKGIRNLLKSEQTEKRDKIIKDNREAIMRLEEVLVQMSNQL